MPRQQRPPDPEEGPTAAFAQKLFALRQAIGSPSYREMGERANISHTSLSRAAKGDRLPTWGTTKAFVLACDADVELWRWRWEDASRAVEEERKLQNAPTVPLRPVASPIYDLDPPGNHAASPGRAAKVAPGRASAPDRLAGELPALTRQLAAEIQANSTAPTTSRHEVKSNVALMAQRTEQGGSHHQQQSTVQLLPAGSGQRYRVVGISSRPTGAHRRATARRRTPRTVPHHTRLENQFLGEHSQLWQRDGRVVWIVTSALALTWIISSILSTIIG